MDITSTVALIVGLLAIIGFIGNWYYKRGKSDQLELAMNTKIDKLELIMNNKIDQHIKDNEKAFDSLRGQVGRQWDWQTAHEKEANTMRLEIQRQFGKVEAGIAIHDNQFEEIKRMIVDSTKILTTEINKLDQRVADINRK